MWTRFAVVAVFLLSFSANAQTTFTLQEEDDSLVSTALASDEGYTNGTRLLWTWKPVGRSGVAWWAGKLCGQDCESTFTAGVGQNMYTPEYLLSRTPIVGDRPYGGWLYGVAMLDTTRQYNNDHFELYVGVIGRDSHAADAQIFVHKHVTTPAPDPVGWGTQIGEWAALLASYERRVKVISLRSGDSGPEWLDVSPSLGGSAGNVFVSAAATATARLGYNLPSRFIHSSIKSSGFALRQKATEGLPKPSERSWDAFVYASASTAYVARNIFIDSNDTTYRIERRPNQKEYRAGVSFRIRSVRLAYQYTRHTSEFRALVHRLNNADRSHSYGMLMFSIGPDA